METHVWSVAADFKTERDETPDWSCHKMTTDLNWFLSLPVTDGHLNFEKMVLDRSNDETVTRVGVRRTSARQSVFYLVIKMSLTYLVLLALFVALAASAPQKPKCGPNEFFNSCTGCENFCTDMGLKPCPLVCKMPGECRCDFGFARDVSGNCVDRLTCPPNACPQNEVWEVCGGCEKYCGEEEPFCVEKCGFGRCVCAEGLIRNDVFKCVPNDKCPQKILA